MSNEKRRFSHSLIDTYLDCPRKAYYRYIENVPSPKTAALVKGSACDAAWSDNLAQKIESGEDIVLAEMLARTEQAFNEDVDGQGGASEIDWGTSNKDAELTSALRLTRVHMDQIAPLIQPTEVQMRHIRTLPSGRSFIGFIDFEGVVDGVQVVGDLKTGGRRMAGGDADKGLQPFAYAWLKDEPIQFVFARSIDTGKSAYSELVWTERTAADNEWYGEQVLVIERAFDEGIFPANPRSFLCGPGKCPYFERCMPSRVTSGPTHKED